MPLGAIIAKDEIMDWPPGSHASTFGGNPVSCAAALATIELLEESLIENADRMGRFLTGMLHDLARSHPLIGHIRGKGLMIGLELVRDRATKERAPRERNDLVQACFRRGLLVLGCGENSLRLAPPLIVTEDECERAVQLLDEALAEVESGVFPVAESV
jgi:4-aminobutyrate aminotransferase